MTARNVVLVFLVAIVVGVLAAVAMGTTHEQATAPHQCAVTLYADGHWTTASVNDPDALHYSC